MHIRPAQPDDAASIAALSIEVWIGTYLKHGVTSFFADFVLEEFTPTRSRALIDDPAEHILVSQNQEGIDGFIRVSTGQQGPVDGCSDIEIATFYVQSRHHGKGIGKALLDAAFGHCRALGASSVWLATNAQNTPAIRFYLGQGFEQIGQTNFTIEDQAYLNNVYRYLLT